jgi:tagatose-1,6-bisphosphate aldolase
MDLKIFQQNGKYLMLALDHRGSFRKYINPKNPDKVTHNDLVKTKAIIIDAVRDQFSGVLIDAEWGLSALRSFPLPEGELEGVGVNKPYLLPLEKSGYMDKTGERVTELEHTAAEIKALGASGAKLLLYFNPESTVCGRQIKIAQQALEDSHKNNLPFFLEIVTYGNEELGKSRAEWVLRSIKMLLESGVVPDVWKLEYPDDKKSCQEITRLVGKTPWILLTRGEVFKVFERQLKDAVAAGAAGFLAGRALWQEIADYKSDEEKKEFLNTIVADRFRQISKVCLL